MKIIIDPERKVIQIIDGIDWTFEHVSARILNYPMRPEDCHFPEINSDDNISTTDNVREE